MQITYKLRKAELLLFAFILLFSSCEEDVDLFSGKQEETVIYGVLNLKNKTHSVKIFKTLLESEENMREALKNAEKLYYDTSEIIVNLIQWKDSTVVKTISMHPAYYDSVGAPSDNMFYEANEILLPNSEYEVRVSFKNKDKVVSSTIEPYGQRNYYFSFYNEQRTIGIQEYINSSKAEYVDESLYDKSLLATPGYFINRLLYLEVIDGDTTHKNFDWKIVPEKYWKPFPAREGQFYTHELRFLGDVFPYNPDAKRILIGWDWVYSIKSPEMEEYIRNTNYPRSEFQYVDYLDNVDGGLGFFTSSYDWTFWACQIIPLTKDSLAHGRFTHQLNFADSQGNYHHF